MVGIAVNSHKVAPGEHVIVYFQTSSLWMGKTAWKFEVDLYTSDVPYVNDYMKKVGHYSLGAGSKEKLASFKMTDKPLHLVALFDVYDPDGNKITGYDKAVASVVTVQPLKGSTGGGLVTAAIDVPKVAAPKQRITAKVTLRSTYSRKIKIEFYFKVNGRQIGGKGTITMIGGHTSVKQSFDMPDRESEVVFVYVVKDATSGRTLQTRRVASAKISTMSVIPKPKSPDDGLKKPTDEEQKDIKDPGDAAPIIAPRDMDEGEAKETEKPEKTEETDTRKYALIGLAIVLIIAGLYLMR